MNVLVFHLILIFKNQILVNAGLAQLVERNFAKVKVDGSNPLSRSKFIYKYEYV